MRQKRGIAHWAAAGTVLGGLLVAGCAREPTAQPAKPMAQVALTPIDSRGLADAIARHRGKVVLVEFWATWCEPCVKLFPHTAALQERLAENGLVVISVSMDDLADREAVLRFLRGHRATFENFISQYGLGSEGFEAFSISDGALPHLKLYDRDGRLQETFLSGGKPLDAERLDRAVEHLVKLQRCVNIPG